MKHLAALFLSVCFIFTLSVCGTKEQGGKAADVTGDETKTGQETGQEKERGRESDQENVGEKGKEKDMEKKVLLNSGYEMPVAGIGTYSLLGEECSDSIVAALECGVRLIDTAYRICTITKKP